MRRAADAGSAAESAPLLAGGRLAQGVQTDRSPPIPLGPLTRGFRSRPSWFSRLSSRLSSWAPPRCSIPKRPAARIFLAACLLTLGGLLVLLFENSGQDVHCIIHPELHEKLLYMIHAWDDVLTQHKIPHWIEYGTLLGSMVRGDLLPWDHDADVGYELSSKASSVLGPTGPGTKRLRDKYGIDANQAMMEYKGAWVDVFGFGPMASGEPVMWSRLGRGASSALGKPYDDMPKDLVVPTRRCFLGNRTVSCPRVPAEFLAVRYPHTYSNTSSVGFPYKLSCWLPWNWYLWKESRVQPYGQAGIEPLPPTTSTQAAAAAASHAAGGV